MQEFWRDIKGYEGKYQISNLGRIKSLYFKNKQVKVQREKILKPQFDGNYYFIMLSINNKRKIHFIHRLIAMTFIPNKNNYACVNHINGIKTDNRIENLEWCSHSQNTKHAYKIGLINVGKGKDNYNYNKPGNRRKKVIQYDENGNVIKVWEHAKDIEEELKINANKIRKCCRENKKMVGGFKWEYMI